MNNTLQAIPSEAAQDTIEDDLHAADLLDTRLIMLNRHANGA